MWMSSIVLLTERHAKHIAGVLSCYDRVIVQGMLPAFCSADGMTAYLTKRGIRIFKFAEFAKPLTDAIKTNAEELAAASGLQIDHVRKKRERCAYGRSVESLFGLKLTFMRFCAPVGPLALSAVRGYVLMVAATQGQGSQKR
jgi:hypothetical protein